MVIAQAQKVEVEGDAVVFTFAPVHKACGRSSRAARVARAAGARDERPQDRRSSRAKACRRRRRRRPSRVDPAPAHKATLRARAKADRRVQAVLDVFGGEIEDVRSRLDKLNAALP